jgi:hypothetical protein
MTRLSFERRTNAWTGAGSEGVSVHVVIAHDGDYVPACTGPGGSVLRLAESVQVDVRSAAFRPLAGLCSYFA